MEEIKRVTGYAKVLDDKDETRDVLSYTIVRVGGFRQNFEDPLFTEREHPLFTEREQTIRKIAHLAWYDDKRSALSAIASVIGEEERWRVLEIPPGEPHDWDGTVVAEVQVGRLF